MAEASVLENVLVQKRTGIKPTIIKNIYKYDLQFMPPGYKDYDCKKYGGPAKAHKTFAAQIVGGSIKPNHKSTALFTVKGEFGADDKKVPVYMVTDIGKKTGAVNLPRHNLQFKERVILKSTCRRINGQRMQHYIFLCQKNIGNWKEILFAQFKITQALGHHNCIKQTSQVYE